MSILLFFGIVVKMRENIMSYYLFSLEATSNVAERKQIRRYNMKHITTGAIVFG